MNEMQIYTNEQFGVIRCTVLDGETWFVGKDVAQALGYSNYRDALGKHVDEEDKKIVDMNTVAKRDSITGNPNMTVINESGLYSLILSSKLERAKQFKRWVTSEVLPAIRKTGSYVNVNASKPSPFEQVKEVTELGKFLMAEFNVAKGIALSASTELIENHYGTNLDAVKKLIPPVEHEVGLMNATEVGKLWGVSARKANEILTGNGLQEKVDKEYRLTEKGKAYGEMQPYTRFGHSGYQIKWNDKVRKLAGTLN